MKIGFKIAQIVGAGALIALFAGSAQAVLVNGGFDADDATSGDLNSATGWFDFNGSFVVNPANGGTSPVADSSPNSIKLFGNGGFGQQVNGVAPGTLFEGSGVGMNFSGDACAGACEGLFQVVFRNAAGAYAGTAAGGNFALNFNVFESNRISSTTPSDIWTTMDFSGGAPILAPDDTSYLEFFALHVNSDGAVFLDSASLTVIPVPAAVWLFGSGLVGLVGVARRRKQA